MAIYNTKPPHTFRLTADPAYLDLIMNYIDIRGLKRKPEEVLGQIDSLLSLTKR